MKALGDLYSDLLLAEDLFFDDLLKTEYSAFFYEMRTEDIDMDVLPVLCESDTGHKCVTK